MNYVTEKTVQISKIILEKVMNELCIKRNQKTKNKVTSNPTRPGTTLGLIIKLIEEIRLTRMAHIK